MKKRYSSKSQLNMILIGILFLFLLGIIINHVFSNKTNEGLCLCDRVGLMECQDRNKVVSDYNSGLTEYSKFKYVEVPYEDRNYVW